MPRLSRTPKPAHDYQQDIFYKFITGIPLPDLYHENTHGCTEYTIFKDHKPIGIIRRDGNYFISSASSIVNPDKKITARAPTITESKLLLGMALELQERGTQEYQTLQKAFDFLYNELMNTIVCKCIFFPEDKLCNKCRIEKEINSILKTPHVPQE